MFISTRGSIFRSTVLGINFTILNNVNQRIFKFHLDVPLVRE